MGLDHKVSAPTRQKPLPLTFRAAFLSESALLAREYRPRAISQLRSGRPKCLAKALFHRGSVPSQTLATGLADRQSVASKFRPGILFRLQPKRLLPMPLAGSLCGNSAHKKLKLASSERSAAVPRIPVTLRHFTRGLPHVAAASLDGKEAAMNSGVLTAGDLSRLKINILAALWRAHPKPLGLSALYINCDCEESMTAYVLAVADLELAGWVRDTPSTDPETQLTKAGVALISCLIVRAPGKVPTPRANQLQTECLERENSSRAAQSPQSSDPWTAAHERVFGTKPAGTGNHHSTSVSEKSPGQIGIHLLAPGDQHGLKSPQQAGESCSTCATRTTRTCAQCEAPICRAHGYSAEGNEPGELCRECRDAAQLDIEGIRTHGRADIGGG